MRPFPCNWYSTNISHRRDVGNADFGLDIGNAFLAPVRSSRSRSKTPSQQIRGGRRTPGPSTGRSREPSQPKSARNIPTSITTQSTRARNSDNRDNADITTARPAKRRKTLVQQQSDNAPDEPSLRSGTFEASRRVGQDRADADDDWDENNAPSAATKKPAKRRKRKSIGQQSLFKKRKSSTGTAVVGKTEVPRDRSVGEADVLENDDEPETTQPDEDIRKEEADEENDDAHSDVYIESVGSQSTFVNGGKATAKIPQASTKRRKKRKSIGQQARRRKTTLSKDDDLTVEESIGPPETAQEHPVQGQPVLEEETQPSKASRYGHLVRTASQSPVESVAGGDNSEDGDYEDEDDFPAPAPGRATSKKMKMKASSRVRQSSASNTNHTSTRIRASFPIITQRLQGFDTLPTIEEHGESELESEEELARESELRAALDRPHPNAVDVLGQYCRETVQSAVDRLKEGPASNRSERKRKQAALEAVGQDLNDQFIDMSAAVENRIQLSRRARKAKKTKAELQSRWLEIRRQREDIALKCDEVRQQNWQREQEREQKWRISEAAHKLTLEVERTEGGGAQQHDLEFLLRTLADDVSDVSGQPLLEQIKSFNAQLERTASILEGRA